MDFFHSICSWAKFFNNPFNTNDPENEKKEFFTTWSLNTIPSIDKRHPDSSSLLQKKKASISIPHPMDSPYPDADKGKINLRSPAKIEARLLQCRAAYFRHTSIRKY